MKTLAEVIDFAEMSALAALDNWGDMEDPINSYRDNIRDTLNDEGLERFEEQAFEAFDAHLARVGRCAP